MSKILPFDSCSGKKHSRKSMVKKVTEETLLPTNEYGEISIKPTGPAPYQNSFFRSLRKWGLLILIPLLLAMFFLIPKGNQNFYALLFSRYGMLRFLVALRAPRQ